MKEIIMLIRPGYVHKVVMLANSIAMKSMAASPRQECNIGNKLKNSQIFEDDGEAS